MPEMLNNPVAIGIWWIGFLVLLIGVVLAFIRRKSVSKISRFKRLFGGTLIGQVGVGIMFVALIIAEPEIIWFTGIGMFLWILFIGITVWNMMRSYKEIKPKVHSN